MWAIQPLVSLSYYSQKHLKRKDGHSALAPARLEVLVSVFLLRLFPIGKKRPCDLQHRNRRAGNLW